MNVLKRLFGKNRGLEIRVQQDYQHTPSKEVLDIIEDEFSKRGYKYDSNESINHYGFYYYIEFPKEVEEIYLKNGEVAARDFIIKSLLWDKRY